MPYLFHGTERSNVDSIMKNGFQEGTFFAKHLEDSLSLGCGEVIFWVWFDYYPTEYWEYVSREIIKPNRIRMVSEFNIESIYENRELALEIRRKHNAIDNPESIFCENCEGRGEITEAPFFRVKHREIEVCEICGGFGCYRKDGSKMNK